MCLMFHHLVFSPSRNELACVWPHAGTNPGDPRNSQSKISREVAVFGRYERLTSVNNDHEYMPSLRLPSIISGHVSLPVSQDGFASVTLSYQVVTSVARV
jgi:hypothetical protein